MSGKKGMASPRYTAEMKTAINVMISEGKTHAEIAEYFGLKDKFVVHQILKLERRKQEAADAIPKKKGRPGKYPPTTIAALKAENERLRIPPFLKMGIKKHHRLFKEIYGATRQRERDTTCIVSLFSFDIQFSTVSACLLP